jgi:hypothetical protein
VVQETLTLEVNKIVFLSPIGQQFTRLPPLFTCLLVGAAMLLLVILLAAERRTELGMSRALGLRRSHAAQPNHVSVLGMAWHRFGIFDFSCIRHSHAWHSRIRNHGALFSILSSVNSGLI